MKQLDTKSPDTVITEVGEITFSDTQCIKVLVLEEHETLRPKISLQKWWREDNNSEWRVGKGFKLDVTDASEISHLLQQAVLLCDKDMVHPKDIEK